MELKGGGEADYSLRDTRTHLSQRVVLCDDRVRAAIEAASNPHKQALTCQQHYLLARYAVLFEVARERRQWV